MRPICLLARRVGNLTHPPIKRVDNLLSLQSALMQKLAIEYLVAYRKQGCQPLGERSCWLQCAEAVLIVWQRVRDLRDIPYDRPPSSRIPHTER
jgi:hypothetical protein